MRENYDSDKLKELCANFDLVEYVGQNYDLKKKGGEYAMHCPIHKNDDTPSLYINPDKNLWTCYGCHAGGTILDWLIKVEHLTFPQAAEKLKKLTGQEIVVTETASSLKFFKCMEKIAGHETKAAERQVLPESYLEQFDPCAAEEWLEEGISAEAMRRFGIREDKKSNRIIYPVRDNDGNLIGVKGRTRFENYKILGIKKYIFLVPPGRLDFFQGMYENRENIIRKNSAIVVEGIKSVMKLWQWGYDNAIAAETSLINDYQVEVLLKLGISEVTIAFDNDVDSAALKKSADKLKRWMNVLVVQDINGILGEKSEKLAPCDKGEKIWKKLYDERKRYV